MFPTVVRVWMRARSYLAKEFEARTHRPYIFCGAGMGALRAAWQVAFHFKPLKCDERPNLSNPDYNFYNNVAHSSSGNGAVAKNVAN